MLDAFRGTFDGFGKGCEIVLMDDVERRSMEKCTTTKSFPFDAKFGHG